MQRSAPSLASAPESADHPWRPGPARVV